MKAVSTVFARVLIALVFVMSTIGNKIPNFKVVTQMMAAEGIPSPTFLLIGAIAFLLVGGASLILGYRARVGAALLIIFLIPATYYFHDFWKLEGQAQQMEMVHFMKNLSILGGLLFVAIHGSGAGSIDRVPTKEQ